MDFLWTFLLTAAAVLAGLLYCAPFSAVVALLIHWAADAGGLWRLALAILGIVLVVALASDLLMYLAGQVPAGWA